MDFSMALWKLDVFYWKDNLVLSLSRMQCLGGGADSCCVWRLWILSDRSASSFRPAVLAPWAWAICHTQIFICVSEKVSQWGSVGMEHMSYLLLLLKWVFSYWKRGLVSRVALTHEPVDQGSAMFYRPRHYSTVQYSVVERPHISSNLISSLKGMV